MRTILLLSLMLAGCGERVLVDQTNVTPDQIAAAVAKLEVKQPNPGRWESRVTLGDFNLAGYESAIFTGLWDVEARSATVLACVLPEGGARADMAMLKKAGSDCTYDRFVLTASTIEAQMTCKPSSTKRLYISVNGTHSPDHFQLYLKADAPGGNPQAKRIEFSTTINSIRNGDCRGNEDIVAAPALVGPVVKATD